MGNNLSDRFEDWAVEIIKLSAKLSKTFVGRHIGGQLFRSATSAGANYEEACGGESRSDFIHKLQIVLKELNNIPPTCALRLNCRITLQIQLS